jgi:hypothetical protein
MRNHPNNRDSDGDVCRWLEVQYNLNPLVNDASGIRIMDKWSNLEEYMKGTIPMMQVPIRKEQCPGCHCYLKNFRNK